MAIAEMPTSSGPVDDALLVGLDAVAEVEAKRGAVDVPGVLEHQAMRYARDLHPDLVGRHGPWGERRGPFAFAANGRPTLKQIKTKSGVWSRDLRLGTNPARPQVGRWTPEGLKAAFRGAAARVGPERPPLLGGWA